MNIYITQQLLRDCRRVLTQMLQTAFYVHRELHFDRDWSCSLGNRHDQVPNATVRDILQKVLHLPHDSAECEPETQSEYPPRGGVRGRGYFLLEGVSQQHRRRQILEGLLLRARQSK